MCSDLPPGIPHSLVVQTLKKKERVGTTKGVKLWRAWISNFLLAYSHASIIQIVPKRRFPLPFVYI